MDLYISDLDGTLLNSRQVISRESVETINDLINKGLNFTIATARSYEASINIIAPLELRVPVILNNGAFIYDLASGKNIVENYMDMDSVAYILKTYAEKNIQPMVSAVNRAGEKKIFYKGSFNFGQDVYLNSRFRSKDRRLEIVDDFSAVWDCKVINIFAIDKKKNLDFEYKLFTDNLDVGCHYTEEIYSKGFFWLETTNPKAKKSSAAMYVKNYLKAEKLVCFGDNLNDKPLFEVADEKYAVENAYEELKNIATEVIQSNEENGVARFLRKCFGGV